MTLDYQKIWNVMNSLEMVTTKICSAREILDSAIDKLEEHQYDKAGTLLYAVDEFLQYYLEEFDTKFKDAWKETVTKVHQQDTTQFNIDPAGNYVEPYDYLASSLLTEDRISNFPGEQDDCMPPWGHSDLEYLSKLPPEEPKQDKVVKWQLPVEEVENGDTGEQEYFITFPDDLLEATNLSPGDDVEWVDRGDGSFLLRKITQPKTYTEMLADGYTMTADGFWIKE
jgi:hypothetical protein